MFRAPREGQRTATLGRTGETCTLQGRFRALQVNYTI